MRFHSRVIKYIVDIHMPLASCQLTQNKAPPFAHYPPIPNISPYKIHQRPINEQTNQRKELHTPPEEMKSGRGARKLSQLWKALGRREKSHSPPSAVKTAQNKGPTSPPSPQSPALILYQISPFGYQIAFLLAVSQLSYMLSVFSFLPPPLLLYKKSSIY